MCDNKECSVHSRVDTDKVEFDMGNEWILKVSYEGEWAVFTDDNVYSFNQIMLGQRPHKHMTVLVKVGEGKTLGDLENGLASNCVYNGLLTDSVDEARRVHEAFVDDAKYGLVPETLFSPRDMIDASTPLL